MALILCYEGYQDSLGTHHCWYRYLPHLPSCRETMTRPCQLPPPQGIKPQACEGASFFYPSPCTCCFSRSCAGGSFSLSWGVRCLLGRSVCFWFCRFSYFDSDQEFRWTGDKYGLEYSPSVGSSLRNSNADVAPYLSCNHVSVISSSYFSLIFWWALIFDAQHPEEKCA